MSHAPSDPQSDADRIRLKRLAKLQTASPSTPPSAGPSTPQRQPTPKATPAPAPKRAAISTPEPAPIPPKRKAPTPAVNLDVDAWTDEMIGYVLNVTLNRDVAERTGWEMVWLKPLADELQAEGLSQPFKLNADLTDRLLIGRLEVDPRNMSDDLEFLPVLVSLPAEQTVFEYLVGCWKRLNTSAIALGKRRAPPGDVQRATAALDKLRDLVISYAGLTLQDPDMFPQPTGKPLGAPELVGPLLSLSALSAPLLSSTPSHTLAPTDVVPFVTDLARRFEPDGELAGVLGPALRALLAHPSLARPEGLAGADAGWRRVLAGVEALVNVKGVPAVLTGMDEWCPSGAGAADFEHRTLMGPLFRLGVVERDWPYIAQAYFSEVEKRTQADVDSSFASLRGTLKSLQGSLFQIFNALVRAGAGPREAVLAYFARAIALNARRAGTHVDPVTVASDSFMMNLQSVLLRFAEPFMDSQYTKMDRVDRLYFVRSTKIDLREETRINATAQESADWEKEHASDAAPAPNFISDVFFLTVAMGHYGVVQTINRYEDSLKHYEEIRRHLEMLQGDGSWMGSPLQARTEAAINAIKAQKSKVAGEQFAFRTQLEDPEFVFRSLSFVNFVSTWLIRFVDPAKTHPNPIVQLPLPKEVPMAFRVLPEYMIEDVVETTLFFARSTPSSLELSGKNEVVVFALTFLTSTWYIKNPGLKNKLVDILWAGVSGGSRRGEKGPLAGVLHEHPLALRHMMPALMQFYIEVEQTGAHNQFYDKFSARRLMAHLFKFIWNNPVHKEALNREARNVDKFVRFVNMMVNDVTYLMDESLSDMYKIHEIQTEMADTAVWAAATREHREEREKTLRNLERGASAYCDLARATVDLLAAFTAETKAPFMLPEIVDKLAAMLDYNLDALVGPRVGDLRVKNPEKYRFDLRALVLVFLQVFLNLSEQEEFVRAVAGDGRSYSRQLFEKAMGIAKRRALKTDAEIEQIRLFVEAVEAMKLTIEAEEDLGEIPDEFTDPLMATLMRDPVILPSSRAVVDRSTIKSYLLSEIRDPFNRQPLTIEEVIPDHELKAKIDAFLLERRSTKMNVDE